MTTIQTPPDNLRGLPTDIAPNPHFDAWDETPHAYFTVPVVRTQLGDVILGGTHQIEGFGRAEQRGKPARRFDLEYIVQAATEYTARLVLPNDHMLEIKRYTPNVPFRWAYVYMTAEAGNTKYPAALSADYGSDTARCGCGVSDGQPPSDGSNVDGFESSTTICDACIESWSWDHTVVRHR